MRENRTKSAALGALAGVAGGTVMALMMRKVAPKVMPKKMLPSEFVPKKAVEWAEDKTGDAERLSEATEMKTGMAAHLAYSAAAGAGFALLRPALRRVPAPLTGAMYGNALWLISFEGWMPMLGVMERTTEKPPRKWPAPIMAHTIFGVVTALALEGLEKAATGGPREHGPKDLTIENERMEARLFEESAPLEPTAGHKATGESRR
jgi:uncharacterized membrane protein YagU involved in acid resistance